MTKSRRHLGLATALALIVLAQAPASAAFVFTTLNDPLGVNGTFADGISPNGQQIGGFFNDAGNKLHGFSLVGGVYTTIDNPLGINGTVAQGVNNAGQTVGYYVDAANASHGFSLTTVGGVFTTLN